MMLKPSRALLGALQAVADNQVVCHPAWSHHVPGWGWAGGGDIALAAQDTLTDLHHARLIDVDVSGHFHVDGDPVVLTPAGAQRLSDWQFWASRALRAVAS